MVEKNLFFSVLFLLLGLNVFFTTMNIFSGVFLFVCIVLSVLSLIYGLFKDRKETRKLRSWQYPWWNQIRG